MVKKIRFDLKLSGRNVGTLEELRENFELERIIQYYNDGKLEKWLKSRNCNKEAQKVAAIDTTYATDNIKSLLCEIFGVAFIQEELKKIVNGDDKQVIYLYGDEFNIDTKFKNKTYIFVGKCESQLTVQCSDMDYLCDIENEIKQRNIKFDGANSVTYEFNNGCKVFLLGGESSEVITNSADLVEVLNYSNGCKEFSL